MSYGWDFGDETGSEEAHPEHSYTKAGRYTVRLEAWSAGTGLPSDVFVLEDAVEVIPGPLTVLSIDPQIVELEPTSVMQLEIVAEDQFGNAITELSASWSTAPGGLVDPSGRFEAGTKAGIYSPGVTVQASYGGGSMQASVDVVILPGPIASVSLQTPSDAIFTGDTASLRVAVLDAFGNVISPIRSIWSAAGGTIDGTAADGIFQAGRQPGPAIITVEVTDEHGTARGETVLQVSQGFCEIERQTAEWKAEWYERNAMGALGQLLGEQVLPSLIDLSTFGEVFGGRSDNLRMDAHMRIVVQRNGPVTFRVSGDDGFRLYLGEELVIDEWTAGAKRTRTETRLMPPGVYLVTLQYFEGIGEAILEFEVDEDVLQWTEAIRCFGGYVEPPSVRYFVYEATEESAAQVAERFDIPLAARPRII